jgi:hypothetical protein
MPEGPDELFAAKGRALPTCSEPLAKRRAAAPAPPRSEASPLAQPDNDAQEAGAASVLSIDLRAALAPSDPPARETVAPATPSPPPAATLPPVPPAPQSSTMVWTLIAACLVAAVAAGLFFAAGPQWLDGTPAAEAPVATATPTPPTANADAAPADDVAPDTAAAERTPESASDAPQEAAPETAQSPAEETGENKRLPSFDLVRVEPDGAAVIAGRAAPYAELILLHNGQPIGTAKADWAGEWAFVTDRPLPADSHTISVLVNDPDAEVTLPEGADPPAKMSETVAPGER